MSALAEMTDEQLVTVVLGFAVQSIGSEIGAARLASVMLKATVKLLHDVDGDGGLRLALEALRAATHPGPRPVD